MALSIEQVKEIINRSNFSKNLKERLVLIVPKLEKYTLTGLGLEVDRKDSQLIAGLLVRTWESYSKIIDGFINKKPDSVTNFLKLLTESNETFNSERKLYFLNLALDIKNLALNNKIYLEPSLFAQILDYEISLFWDLPKEEVTLLLKNGILFLERKINLVENLKIVIWNNGWQYTKDFSKVFSNILSQNAEVLGGITIGNWIKKYFNFSSTSSFRNDVVQVAEFLVKDSAVKKLNGEERKTLSEILKLYIWLLNPQIDEDEVLALKEEIRQSREGVSGKVINEEDEEDLENENREYFNSQKFNLPQEILQPPTIPTPKNAPTLKPMSDVGQGNLAQRGGGVVKKEVLDFSRERQQEPEAVKEIKKNFVDTPNIQPTNFRSINIQNILKSKNNELGAKDFGEDAGGSGGLTNFPTAGQGGSSGIKNQSSYASSSANATADMKASADLRELEIDNHNEQVNIDKKLEDLKKKVIK